MFLQRFVLACASLATSASAYEVIQTPCKVGRKEFHDASSCIAKATDLAGDGAAFEVRVRADQPETFASLVSALAKVDGMMIQKTNPLMAAFHQGSKQFWDELAEGARSGKIRGWEVGESIGSYVGMQAVPATLGLLGFAAGATGGGLAGFAAGAVAVSHAPLIGPLIAILAPELALLVPAFAMGQGALLGGIVGTYAGVDVGSQVGSELGGLLGGFVGSELGSALGAANAVHGMLFQLTDGVLLGIDYAIGQNGAAEALSYHLVVQQKLLLS